MPTLCWTSSQCLYLTLLCAFYAGLGVHNNIFEQLSDTQKEALKELKTNGADRSDIHEQLADWGIEIPEPPFFSELSDDQKETLKEMREDGADREEIKAQLEDWGIDLPERGSKK